MTKILFTILLLSATTQLNAGQNDKNDDQDLKQQIAHLKRLNNDHVRDIEQLRKEKQDLAGRVKLLEKLCRKLGYTPQETDQKLTKQINSATTIIQDYIDPPFQIGQIGRLGNNKLSAFDIHDADNMIAYLKTSYHSRMQKHDKGSLPLEVNSIQDANTDASVQSGRHSYWTGASGTVYEIGSPFNKHEELIWLKGMPTTGLDSNSPIKFSGILKVTSTKTYKTAMGGSNTIFVFEPLNIYE